MLLPVTDARLFMLHLQAAASDSPFIFCLLLGLGAQAGLPGLPRATSSVQLPRVWCPLSVALSKQHVGASITTSSWGAGPRHPGPSPSLSLGGQGQGSMCCGPGLCLGGGMTRLLEMPLVTRGTPQASRNRTYLVPL